MTEKNYKTVAVVPEMPRTIDNQQLHIYTPVGSTGNFGVFKPDGDQFVIVNGVLRADASKLIKLADTPAIVVNNGGRTKVTVAFTKPNDTLNRKFQFIFENIKGETGATGATGAKGDTGDNALVYSGSYTETYAGDVMDEPIHLDIAKFSRTPVKGDTFVLVYYTTETEQTTISLFSIYNVYDTYVEAQAVFGTQYVITGPKGEQGIQGKPGTPGKDGDDGVSITSVTQTGVQGGTQVTITLSNGQSTSFVVYNGINTNFQIVNTLPTENISTSTIYLVPSTKPEEENIYDEYIYVNGNWEHIGSTTIDLSGKLDKVTEVTPNIQFYAKAPDSSQVMTEIKGGNGITVGAASDNKSLEVKVGTKIKLEQNQTLEIVNPFNTKYIKIGNNKMDFSPVATRFSVGSLDYDAYAKNNYGPNIKTEEGVVASTGLSLHWLGLNMYYEISDVPASTKSGTLPDNASWTYLKDHPEQLRIKFNNEFYQLTNNDPDTGTLVYSHVTYEGSELIIKTITITIATRGWVLTMVKPAEAANFITLRTTSGKLSDADFTKLDSDDNSYILLIYSGQKYKLHRTATSTTDLIYSVVDNEQEYKITILLSDHTWGLQVITLENTSNRVTEIKASSADEEYPSAAATYTYGQTVLTTAKAYADSILGAEQEWLVKISTGEGV